MLKYIINLFSIISYYFINIITVLKIYNRLKNNFKPYLVTKIMRNNLKTVYLLTTMLVILIKAENNIRLPKKRPPKKTIS